MNQPRRARDAGMLCAVTHAVGCLVLVLAGCKREAAQQPPAEPAPIADDATPAPVRRPTSDAATDAATDAAADASPDALALAPTWVAAIRANKLDELVGLAAYPFMLELADLRVRCRGGNLADAAALRKALGCVVTELPSVFREDDEPTIKAPMAELYLTAQRQPSFGAAWRADHTFAEIEIGGYSDFVHGILAAKGGRVHGAFLLRVELND